MIVLFQLAFAGPETANTLDDLLLFEVQLEQSVISEGLQSYREGSQIFLPIGELSQLLTIAVKPFTEKKMADGFIILESRTFFLDLNDQTVSIGSQKFNFDPQLVRAQGEEIFVESSLYSTWFPVDLTIDVPSLKMTVLPRETLPIQARIGREKRKRNHTKSSSADFPIQDTPYELIDRPFIDQTFEWSLSKKKDEAQASTGRYTTLLSGDFLGLETRLIASGSDSEFIENYRMTLGRDDPDGNLLGFLKARSFSVGTINMPSLNYVVRPTSLGQGIYISNRLLSKPSRFDTQSFTGDLLPGWDVELFQNGILIDQQSSNERSIYEFNDIPLFFGSNDFRLIFHGPQGQIREERSRFILEDSLVLPGETYYSVGSVGFENGSNRTIMQLDQSLLRRLSATAGIVSNSLSELNTTDSTNSGFQTTQSYFNLGLRSYWDSMFLSADAISSSQGGSLGAVSIKTGLWNTTVSVSHAVLNDFTSEEFLPSNTPEIARTRARLDTFLPFTQKFPLSLEATRSEFASLEDLHEASAKVSAYFRGVSLSHRLRHFSGQNRDFLNGELQISGRIMRLGLRGGFTYEIEPFSKATSIDLSGNIKLSREYNFTQSISNQMASKETRYELGLNKSLGQYGIGIRAGGSNKGEQFAALRLNIAMGVEPRKSEFFTSAQAMSTTGAVSAHAFLDRNLNGRFDEDESPLENVGFRLDGGMAQARTNNQGIALLTHLPTGKRVNLSVDRNTLDDSQVTPATKGLRILPRFGKIAKLEFPFIITTEIDGLISVDDGRTIRPASNLKLQLVDFLNQETIISETTTAFDGYYVLGEVPPGKYALRIDPSQAAELSILSPELRTLQILPNSNFVNGIDIIVRLPGAQNVQSFVEKKPNLVNLIGQSPDQNFSFIILGSYALEQSYAPVLSQLKLLQLPYVKHEFSRVMKIYRIETKFERSSEANVVKDVLKEYGYRFGEQSDLDKVTLFVGPYYSPVEATKDKAMLSAAFPNQKLSLTTNLESIDMTEIAIGGFRDPNEANQVAASIKKFNFSETSVQRRPSKQWSK